MTTYSIQGFAIVRDANDENAIDAYAVTLDAIFPDDPPNFRYTVDIPASGDELLDAVDIVDANEPIFFQVDGLFGDPTWEANIGKIITPAGTHFIFTLEDPNSNTEYVFQMGGTPFTIPTTLAEFNTLESSITGGGSITAADGVGFEPGVDIDASQFLNTTSTENDFFAAQATDTSFDGGDGDDTIEGGTGNDTLLGGDGSDRINGNQGNDSINPGDNVDFDLVVLSSGNDTINAGDMTNGFLSIGLFELIDAVTVNIDGSTGNGSIVKTPFETDTLIGMIAPLNAGAGPIGGLSIDGTGNADTYNVTVVNSQWMSITGGLGNDTINITGDGRVRLNYNDGGPIVADLGAGTVSRSGEIDTITGTVWELRGSNGSDSIMGTSADESFIGRAGDDTINGGNGFDRMRFDRSGNDSAVNVDIANNSATGTFNGSAFSFTISNLEWIRGTRNHNDSITGDTAKELLEGLGGNDTLIGGGNEDTLRGGEGADSLDGGDGFDIASYETAASRVRIDLLNAGAAIGEAVGDTFTNIEGFDLSEHNDVFNGDNGVNWAYGLAGDDGMKGRGGRDRLFGEEGNDTLNGGKGRDRLEGGDGDDLLQGLGGIDNLRGGKGDDTMEGGDGRDVFVGGRGRDLLDGGNDDDVLSGSTDADTFRFADGHGNDTITDFEATNDNEKIDLTDVSAISTIGDITDPGGAGTQQGSDVLIDTGGGNSILLQGVQLSDLGAEDFIFG